MTAKDVISSLNKYANPEKAKHALRFFKTGKGEYGEGDKFIGATMPEIRTVVKDFRELELTQVQKLLDSPIHEHRMAGLLIIVDQYQRAKKDHVTQTKLYKFYLMNLHAANNWDLVDVTVPRVIGNYMQNNPREKKRLQAWAKSKDLWERRVSVLATFAFIDQGLFDDSLTIAEILLHDKEDLIHKAVGWMLREIGKKDQNVEERFLKKHYKTMPRTMLRYAIERFDKKKYDFYMGRD